MVSNRGKNTVKQRTNILARKHRQILQKITSKLNKCSSTQTKITYNNYLADTIIFVGGSYNFQTANDIKLEIMKLSFNSAELFDKIQHDILDVLPTKKHNDTDWVSCINKCYKTNKYYIARELNSTAYYLRIITLSVIGARTLTKSQIAFQIATDNKYKLTGKWIDDYKYFKLITVVANKKSYFKNDNIDTMINSKGGKLIMGYGPSASGKTFIAEKIIKLKQLVNPIYNNPFFSIDGGIYRAQSFVYQTIINLIKEKSQYPGLTNLVSAGFSINNKTIFNSNIVKSQVKKYLLFQKQNYNTEINLYVPETAGGCLKYINCDKTFTDYINITGDKDWVGLLIYQHKTPQDCPYKHKYTCAGTIQCGISRENKEGKKYSTAAWENSMRNGEYLIRKAGNYRFKIHNSGSSSGITLIEDLSLTPLDVSIFPKIGHFFKKNRWELT